MRPLQEFPNIFLKISASVYFGLIEERLGAAPLNLPGDLLGYPCVRPTVTDEDEPLRILGRLS